MSPYDREAGASSSVIRTEIGRFREDSVSVFLFGRPRVSLTAGAALTLPADTLMLIAYLALEGESRRSAIAADLWPHLEHAKAMARLRRHLVLLDGIRPVEAPLVERRGAMLKLSAWVIHVDVCDVMSGHVALGAVAYAPLLSGWNTPWANAWRSRGAVALADALRRQITVTGAQADRRAAADLARCLLEHEPYNDDSVRLAMELAGVAGDRASAVHIYDAFVTRLERDRRTTPDRQTTALAERLRRWRTRDGPASERFRSSSTVFSVGKRSSNVWQHCTPAAAS